MDNAKGSILSKLCDASEEEHSMCKGFSVEWNKCQITVKITCHKMCM